MKSTRKIVYTAMFTALIAAGAFFKVPLPPVPITLQLEFAILAGLLIGPGLGALSVACYIFIGLAGLPVFSAGGGLSYIFQPTFGYIIGFAVGAFISGTIIGKREKPSFIRTLIASYSGMLAVYALGIIYFCMIQTLYLHSTIAFGAMITSCFLLPVTGDLIMCFVVTLLSVKLIPVIGKHLSPDKSVLPQEEKQ